MTSGNRMARRVWTRRAWLGTQAATVLGATHLANSVSSFAEPAADISIRPDIWDGHCHLSSVKGKTPAERAERLLAYADRMGIERLILFMGWPFSTNPSPAELRRQNDQVLAAHKATQDRTLAYAYVTPLHVAASLQEIERCIADGPMVGIKLWVAGRCDQSQIDPIIKRVVDLNGAIFQHTWIKTTKNLEGESTPNDLATLANRFPQGRFICGHAGGNWELGIRYIRRCENVAVETAGFDPTAGMVEMAVRELGAKRVIFSSDAGGRSFASQLSKVVGAQISETDKQLILKSNLRELLQPILKQKGIRA